jgi:hypothetical protein
MRIMSTTFFMIFEGEAGMEKSLTFLLVRGAVAVVDIVSIIKV